MSIGCNECYWCSPEHAGSTKKVCCNTDSEHYNKTFTPEETITNGCEMGETERAVDYRRMTAWQFASKYYM